MTAVGRKNNAKQDQRQQQHRSSQKKGAVQRQPWIVDRQSAASEITERQRQHEDSNDAAPHIDAAAEVRRQDATAQQLNGHDDEAADKGEAQYQAVLQKGGGAGMLNGTVNG